MHMPNVRMVTQLRHRTSMVKSLVRPGIKEESELALGELVLWLPWLPVSSCLIFREDGKAWFWGALKSFNIWTEVSGSTGFEAVLMVVVVIVVVAVVVVVTVVVCGLTVVWSSWHWSKPVAPGVLVLEERHLLLCHWHLCSSR